MFRYALERSSNTGWRLDAELRQALVRRSARNPKGQVENKIMPPLGAVKRARKVRKIRSTSQTARVALRYRTIVSIRKCVGFGAKTPLAG
jgi:hypothetical protein